MKQISALTIFIGSFLLFLVQPMVGNLLLPVFGGTSTVWILCLCAFQALLVVGYVYAHVLGEIVGIGSRLKWCHVALMLLSAAVLCFCSDLVVSLVAIAVLYATVGSNAALVQRLVASGRQDYRLYAISNVGSFVGLLAFPFVVEFFLPTSRQLQWYALGVAVYSSLLALLMARVPSGESHRRASFGILSGTTVREAAPWFLLSAASCFVLDGLTSHLCQEITPLPLLWCALLAIYLLTWSLAFNERGSRMGRSMWPLILLCMAFLLLHAVDLSGLDYVVELLVCAILLFAACWYLHAHLYMLRPDVGKLTGYYFVIALGGSVGGVFATLVVPLAFDFVAEFPLAQIALLCILACHGLIWVKGRRPERYDNMRYVAALVVVLASVVVWRFSNHADGILLVQERNFYGVSKVVKCFPDGPRKAGADGGEGPMLMAFRNNGTVHGVQHANGSWRRYAPTMYFTEVGGGMAVLNHPAYKAHRPMRVALLGMGVGTMAYYGRKDDVYRFFEIDPNVIRIATNPSYFTFLAKSDATIEISEGDARKLLEREVQEAKPLYDLIVVDVFSGDSVPPHLATAEAMDLYSRCLAQDGIIAFHITNWHIDLLPIVNAMAKASGFHLRAVVSTSKNEEKALSFWAYLSREPLDFTLDDDAQQEIDIAAVEERPVLTDDHHSLMPYIMLFPQDCFRYLPADK